MIKLKQNTLAFVIRFLNYIVIQKIMLILKYTCSFQKKMLPNLTLPAPCISESCIKIKTNWNFYFNFSWWYLKRFMKALKAFIKPFQAPQRSAKIKISVNFFPLSGIGAGGVNLYFNLRFQWRVIFAIVIRCYRLQLWE